LISSLVLFVLSLAGILPLTLFSIAGAQIGIVVLVLILSLALADRINAYRKENDAAQIALVQEQEEALRTKNEHAQALEEMNEKMAVEFEQRTRELSFAQQQINSLFENSPLSIGTAATDGRVLTANAAMKALFGYPGDEIYSANVMDFFPDAEVRQVIMDQLFAEKLIRAPMLQLQRRDGSIIYTNLTESIMSRGDQDVLLGIVDDITEQVLAEQALQAKAEETAVAEERNRIARELHDSVTQSLYTSSLIAEALPKVWDTHPDEARRSLEELRTMSIGALAEMRTLLLELRPGELADRNLSELLHQLTNAMTARSDLPITTTVVGNCPMPTDVQIALYRIAQEALNNINKHARADRAWINLNCGDGQVTLLIGDNGRGITQEAAQAHQMGLRFIQERAQAIDAHIAIESSPESGTEIKVVWQMPLLEEEE
jgi:PAS domain S-box-containing protein